MTPSFLNIRMPVTWRSERKANCADSRLAPCYPGFRHDRGSGTRQQLASSSARSPQLHRPKAAAAPDPLPDKPEQQRRREGAEADDQMIKAEGRAAQMRRRKIGDERLLHAFGQPEIHAVNREKRPRMPLPVCAPKAAYTTA